MEKGKITSSTHLDDECFFVPDVDGACDAVPAPVPQLPHELVALLRQSYLRGEEEEEESDEDEQRFHGRRDSPESSGEMAEKLRKSKLFQAST